MSAEKKSKYILVVIFLLGLGGIVYLNLRSSDTDKIDASVKRCLAAVMARDAARLVEEIDPAYYYVNQNSYQDNILRDERSLSKFDNAIFSNKSKQDLYTLALLAFTQCESIDIRLLNNKVFFQDDGAEAFPVFRATIRLKGKATPDQPASDAERPKASSPREFLQEGPAIHKFRLKYKKEGDRWLIAEIEELRDEPVSIE